jgi:hypothetical protein
MELEKWMWKRRRSGFAGRAIESAAFDAVFFVLEGCEAFPDIVLGFNFVAVSKCGASHSLKI